MTEGQAATPTLLAIDHALRLLAISGEDRLAPPPLLAVHLLPGEVAVQLAAQAAAEVSGAKVVYTAWRELVDASERDFPLRAARLCLAQALASLTTPDSKRYPAIVDLLMRARALYDKDDDRCNAEEGALGLGGRAADREAPAERAIWSAQESVRGVAQAGAS